MNRAITSQETEVAIKKISKQRKIQKWMASWVNSYQTFREKFIPNLLKMHHKLKRKEHFSTHFIGPKLHCSDTKARHEHDKKFTGQSN
jgi:hypothetical protein